MASEFQRLKTTQLNFSVFMGATTIDELEYDCGTKSALFFRKRMLKMQTNLASKCPKPQSDQSNLEKIIYLHVLTLDEAVQTLAGIA